MAKSVWGVAEGKKSFRQKDSRERLSEALEKRGFEASHVHHTRLKEAIIGRFPGIREETDGKNVLFVFPDSVQDIMKAAIAGTAEGDSWIVAKAAAMLRCKIEEGPLWNFSGEFEDKCQEIIPLALTFFLRTTLEESSLKLEHSQSTLTIGQLMIYNSVSKRAIFSKSKHQTLPLTAFLGLCCHSQFRSKEFINFFNNLGLSDSYKKVIQHERLVAFTLSKKNLASC